MITKHKIFFPSGIITAQDSTFLTQITICAKNIFDVPDTYYHYLYQRVDSLDSCYLSHKKAKSKLNAFRLNLKYICNEIKDYITKYESSEITFKDFKSSVSAKYNEICSKDMTEVCEYISTDLINSTDIALSDNVGCDIFEDQEMKNNCLQSSDVASYLEPFVGTSQRTIVSNIKVKLASKEVLTIPKLNVPLS